MMTLHVGLQSNKLHCSSIVYMFKVVFIIFFIKLRRIGRFTHLKNL